jgi:ribonuclease HI
MKTILLFTDGSVNVQSKTGWGAFLAFQETKEIPENLPEQVRIKQFENTSSTKLELQTLLWALQNIETENCKIVVYTDSQNIIGLPARHERFQKNEYHNKKGELIKNHQLYKDFFQQTDKLDIDFIKVRGHKKTAQKDNIDKIFTIVDRASRRALREER